MTNLLCLSCIKNQIKCKKFASKVNIDDAMIMALTSNVTFASTLVMECQHGHHTITVESPQVSKIHSNEMNAVPHNEANTV